MEYRLIKLNTIKLAVNGDNEAVRQIVKHYQTYIYKLATIQVNDGVGGSYTSIDPWLVRKLETKLISKISSFNFI